MYHRPSSCCSLIRVMLVIGTLFAGSTGGSGGIHSCEASNFDETSSRNHPTTSIASTSTKRSLQHRIIMVRGGASADGSRWASFAGARRKEQKQSSSSSWLSPPSSQSSDSSSSQMIDKQEPMTTEMIDAFLTRDSRQRFIAKVYFILCGQLLTTVGMILLFAANPSWSAFMKGGGLGVAVPWLSLMISTIAWYTVHISVKARREAPMKWQLLGAFTFGESVAVAFITTFFRFQTVIQAMGATAAATLGISAYTFLQKNPKYDLSQWGAGLSSAGMIFLVYAIIHLLELYGVLPQGFLPYRESWFGMAGAILFSFYLAYHTKLIVAGKHSKYQMNEKDEVFGAMCLYEDIINIFIYILRILGEDRN